MSNQTQDLVEAFFTGLKQGEVSPRLISPDFSAWTLTSGDMDQQRFCGGVKLLAAIVEGELIYKRVSLTCDDNAAAVEVTSDWRLNNGDRAQNNHVFLFQIRNGRISHVREYMNPTVPSDVLGPAMQAAMSR